MERKIIRRIPLPEMDLNEDDLDSLLAQDESGSSPISLMSAVAAETGTKTLNYTADMINNKLSHVNSFAVATLTQDAYATLFLLSAESSISDAMVEGTYMLYTVPDNSSSALDFGSPIVNFKIYMNSGKPIYELTCVSGQIKDIGLEIHRFKGNWARWCVFVKSNSFRGVVYFKELNLAYRNASIMLYVNSQELTSISNAWDFRTAIKYNNVASQVNGLSPFILKINALPTNDSNLFTSFFGENSGMENHGDLFQIIKSGNIPSIILTMVKNDTYTSIMTSSEVRIIDGGSEYYISFSFVYGGKTYHIEFGLADDGLPIDGSGAVSIT